MKSVTMAILAAVVLAVPNVAAAQTASSSCIQPGTVKPIHSAAYYECKGHAPKAALWLAQQDASEPGTGS